MKNTNKGFTLLELLMVIAVVGVLASIILVSLTTARQKARDAQRISDIKQIRNALALYFSDNQYYPASLNALVTGAVAYLPSLPVDPSGGTGLCRPTYCYARYPSANPTTYHIGAQLELQNPVLDTDRDCVSNDGGQAYSCTPGSTYFPLGSKGAAGGFDGSTNNPGPPPNNPDYIFDLTPQ